MVKGITALCDDGKVEFLEKAPQGKYMILVVFLENLTSDEIEDMMLAKRMGLEKDFKKATKALQQGDLKTSAELRAKFAGKQHGSI